MAEGFLEGCCLDGEKFGCARRREERLMSSKAKGHPINIVFNPVTVTKATCISMKNNIPGN